MRRKRSDEQRIFFPWEGSRGWRRFRLLGRARPALVVLSIVAFVVWVGMRERNAAGLRRTRAALLSLRAAIDTYMADHEFRCPPSLADVVPYGAFDKVPVDAWGRPFRFNCPARLGTARYELLSDGPDGLPGGLDRIE